MHPMPRLTLNKTKNTVKCRYFYGSLVTMGYQKGVSKLVLFNHKQGLFIVVLYLIVLFAVYIGIRTYMNIVIKSVRNSICNMNKFKTVLFVNTCMCLGISIKKLLFSGVNP